VATSAIESRFNPQTNWAELALSFNSMTASIERLIVEQKEKAAAGK